MSLERAEGVLCLVGADTPAELEGALERVRRFIEQSTGLRFIDVVYTATCEARGKQCVVGMWATSLGELTRKILFALNALRSGRTRLRDKSGVFLTTHPLALSGGKIAFVFPGTGSFHLEMMRDLALTFDGVRQRFDDMEEAFAGFCDVASPSEWLFSTAPEHALPASANADFMPLLACASTYLASKVFADFLRGVGVRPDVVGGVGLGSFSAFHATHHDPKLRLVQILRDAGRLLLRLGQEARVEPWVQLTVTGIAVAQLQELVQRDPARLVITQQLTDEDCVLAVAPEKQTEVEIAIHNGGGVSVAEPLLAPFNTGHGSAKMGQLFERFFAKYVTSEPQVPFYSCVTGAPMGHSTSSVVSGLVEQMMAPLNFERMIEAMYDAGCRLFVEVGARGSLTPLMEKVLAKKAEPAVIIPMHTLHRSGGVQVGQALGLLAAHGVPVDYSGLRFFRYAKRLELDSPVTDESVEAMSLRLTRQLPAIRPEVLDIGRLVDTTAQESGEAQAEMTHAHSVPALTGGVEAPFLRDAKEERRTETELELSCCLRVDAFPCFNDCAIGSAGVSMSDPQMRGLTLFPVSFGIEVMAEMAERLLPNRTLQEVSHIRSPRWLSFTGGQLALRLSATREGDSVRVRLYSEEEEAGFARAAMEAVFTFGDVVPEPPAQLESQPLASPKLVNWRTHDIYPKRLFQGPFLRNVRLASGWGYNGLDYEVQVPARSALIRGVRKPCFSAMPLVLDATLSGFPLWRSHERFHGAISLPFRCKSIRYYAAWIPDKTQLRCALRLTNVTTRTFQVDILVSDLSGHVVLQVEGWEEVSGRASPALHDFVTNPSKYFVSQPLPATILPNAESGVEGALILNATPEFFTAHRELWLKALAAVVLTHVEREDFLRMGGVPARKLEWLLGRTAAKESIRRLLLRDYNLYVPSADIAIWKDDLGKPHPVGDWQGQVSVAPDLSIAHTGGLILGATLARGRIGLDVESASRDLTEDFLRGAFTLEEQELATRSGDGPTAILRFWCAKEAISKALGTGIRFAPTDLRIRTADPATGMLAMELRGRWAENFPHLRGQQIPIKTTILYNHVIACCILN